MRRWLLIIVLIVGLTGSVCAVDVMEEEQKLLQLDTLETGLPASAREAMQDYSPSQASDPGTALLNLVKWASGLSVSTLREALRTAAMLLAAALVCRLVRQTGEGSFPAASMTGALAITAIFTTGMRSMIGLADTMLADMEAYAKLLLPVMCSAAAASGAVTGAGALYMGSSLFFSLLISLIRTLLIPLIYAFIGLAAAECALKDGRLSGLRQLTGWCICAALKGMMYVFTAYLSLTGLLSGSSDEAAVEAAKSTLSAAIPVVGAIVSDASEAVLQSARLLRTTAGTFGILAVLAMALVPFAKIGVCFLTMKLTTAVAELTAEKQHAELLDALTGAMGYLLGMVGCTALMLVFSTCCFMKVVNG